MALAAALPIRTGGGSSSNANDNVARTNSALAAYQTNSNRLRTVSESNMTIATSSNKLSSLEISGNLRLALTINGPSYAMSVRFSKKGNFVAAGYADGTIQMYDVSTGKSVSTLVDDYFPVQLRQPVTCLRFNNSDNLLLATYASGSVKFYRTSPTSSSSSAGATCYNTINEGRQTLSAAFNPTTTRFVTTGSTPQIRLYDVETCQLITTLEAREHRAIMDGHRARVFTVQYNTLQQNVFLTGGWDDTVQYWDERQPHAVRKISGPHICGDALDIDSNRGQILTGSWRTENSLQIWDYNTGRKLREVTDDRVLGSSSLYCAQWLGHDQIICGGSEKNLVRTISRSTYSTAGYLSDLPSGVYSVDHYIGDDQVHHQQQQPTLQQPIRVAVASSSVIYLLTRSLPSS